MYFLEFLTLIFFHNKIDFRPAYSYNHVSWLSKYVQEAKLV